jgi:hypothetical protein
MTACRSPRKIPPLAATCSFARVQVRLRAELDWHLRRRKVGYDAGDRPALGRSRSSSRPRPVVADAQQSLRRLPGSVSKRASHHSKQQVGMPHGARRTGATGGPGECSAAGGRSGRAARRSAHRAARRPRRGCPPQRARPGAGERRGTGRGVRDALSCRRRQRGAAGRTCAARAAPRAACVCLPADCPTNRGGCRKRRAARVQTAVDHAQVVGRRTQQESVRNGSWRSVLLVR